MKITNGLFCCFIVCVNATAYAEVVTDGTMGAVQNLAGQMQIPQDLGKMAGNNLFHSFQTFNRVVFLNLIKYKIKVPQASR